MLDKLKDGMKNHVQNGAAEEIAKEEKIRTLFKDTVTNFDDYVFGVAQIETEAEGVKNALASIVTNRIMLDWKDYIVAVHNSKREIIVREITDDSIGEKHLFSENFKIKKDTLIGNEIKDTLNQLLESEHQKVVTV